MPVDVIVGLQRGDEGKGRFVDLEAANYDVIARGNGGANAGHTVVLNSGQEIDLHQVPSGVAHPGKLNVIGDGVYLDPSRLIQELSQLREAGMDVSPNDLLIGRGAHLVMPHHVIRDRERERSDTAQGSTGSGIAFVASDKFLREGVRFESAADLKNLEEVALEGLKRYTTQHSEYEQLHLAREWVGHTRYLRKYMADTTEVLNEEIKAGSKILAEGAQGFWLDINHGMYPAVTSSAVTVNGLLDGLGLSAKHLGKVTGVFKAIKSHVGSGPFVTEITDKELASKIRGLQEEPDGEFGTTTQRPRRVGYPDLVELRKSILVNGVDELVLSKMDHVARFGRMVLVAVGYQSGEGELAMAPSSAKDLSVCEPIYEELSTWGSVDNIRDYDDLPAAAKKFVEFFESNLEKPITKLGVGPRREQVVIRD